MIIEKISVKDLFVPVLNKDLRKTYPELDNIEEFKGLRSLDVKFCWYYSVFYSDEKSHQKRIANSINQSYRDTMDHADRERYLKGDFPDSIRTGIKKFESFDIGSRLRSKFIAERQLDAFEKLSDTDVNSVGMVLIYGEDGSTALGEKRDWNQVSAFVNAMVKINESIPDLLKNVEQGYGVRSVSKLKVISTARDDYQQIKEEKSLMEEFKDK